MVWDIAPIEIIEQLVFWSSTPLSAVIKGGFLKVFDYEHEHEKWRTTSINR